MASIKQLDERRYKITVSNGYRPNGKKISKAKTIQVPSGVPKRGIGQYVAHAAEELERSFKTGYAEDGEMTFEEFASRWLNRQTKYAPSTIAAYRRMLEVVYPMIGGIRLNKLRPMALENMLSALRKRKHHGKRINESTAQRYLSVVSAVLSDAKRNEIIEKNPARMLDLPTPRRTVQRIHAKRGGKAAGCAGKGAAALPSVLSALHVHRLPPGRAVRSAMVGLHRHAERSAAHRQPLPQQRSRQGHRGGRHQKRQAP